MGTDTGKLTVRLPREDVEFLRRYARENRLTVTQVIDRHLQHMRHLEPARLAPELDAITGLVPADVDTEEIWRDYQKSKHQR
jgi:hypothetical protein